MQRRGARGALFAAVLFGLVAVVAAGCAGGGGEDEHASARGSALTGPLPPVGDDASTGVGVSTGDARASTPPPAIVSNVYIVPPGGVQSVAAGKIVLSPAPYTVHAPNGGPTKTPDQIVPGDFLVGDPALSQHFLVKVTSVTTSSTQIVIGTTQAALTDVVQNGSFGGTYGPSASPSVKGGAQTANAQSSQCGGLLGGCFSLTGVLLDMVSGTDNVQVKVTGGYLNFTPSLDIGGQISGFSVKEFHAIASGQLDAQLDLQLQYTGKLAINSPIQIQFVDISSPPLFGDIFGLPVEYNVQFTLALRCQGYDDASDTISGGIQLSSGVSLGARYNGSSWSPVASEYFTPSIIGPHFDKDQGIGFKCWLRPRLDIYFFDTVGPGLFIEPYVQGDETAGSPDATWAFRWGVDGSITGSVQILDWRIADVQLQLFNWSAPLGSGTVTPPPPPPADPCAHTQYGGLYCWDSNQYGFSGGTSPYLYDCQNGKTASKTNCTYGCTVAPPGQNDYCNAAPPPPPDPCAHTEYGGLYCWDSNQYGFSGGTSPYLYDCEGDKTASKTYCTYGCHVAPPGQNDSCNPPPPCGGTLCGTTCCPAGDFCGQSNRCCDGTCSGGCPC
jgi:hypothetical protein